jgi:hypothetical protein
MDLVASVVAANPCPPLPLQCMRRNHATGELVSGFANTHHVLMQAYAYAMQRDCVKENAVRQETQTQLTNVFITAFTATSATDSQQSPDPQELYAAASTFTRSYLHSFMPNRTVPDARFAPYDEISYGTYENNAVVRGACEHLAGMIFYDECPVGTEHVFDTNDVITPQRPYDQILESLKQLPFSAILCKYADVHRNRMTGTCGIVDITDE